MKAGYSLPYEVSGKDIFVIGMFVVMDMFLVMGVFFVMDTFLVIVILLVVKSNVRVRIISLSPVDPRPYLTR